LKGLRNGDSVDSDDVGGNSHPFLSIHADRVINKTIRHIGFNNRRDPGMQCQWTFNFRCWPLRWRDQRLEAGPLLLSASTGTDGQQCRHGDHPYVSAHQLLCFIGGDAQQQEHHLHRAKPNRIC